MLKTVFFAAALLANACFLFFLIRETLIRRREIASEPGNPIALALYSAALQFLAAFGVSDFSISIIVYRRFHLTSDEKLPGTLLVSCVMPVAVMAVGYVSTVSVDDATLMVCVAASILGSLAGTRLVTRLKPEAVRMIMIFALIMSGIFILAGKLSPLSSGGAAMGFASWKLALAGAAVFLLTALSMGGFAVTALLLSVFYAMGLSPLAAFPLAMATFTIGVAIGGVKYIRESKFSLKPALLSTVFGSLGAFVAVRFVHDLNISVLQWIIMAVVFYSAASMIAEAAKHGGVKGRGLFHRHTGRT